MHSKIIEISDKPIERKDFITEDSFEYEYFSSFADYIQNVKPKYENEILEYFDTFGIFYRNGRELTMRDLNEFMNEWRAQIITKANNLDFTNWMSLHNMKALMKETHLGTSYRICFNEEIFDFGYFVQDIYERYKPGDKFYIGGILDYHF